MGERAGDRLTVEVVGKKSNTIRGLLEVLITQSNPEAPEDEIQVKDRTTGEILYRESIWEGPAVAGTVSAVEDDLEQLDVAVCEKHGITGFPRD